MRPRDGALPGGDQTGDASRKRTLSSTLGQAMTEGGLTRCPERPTQAAEAARLATTKDGLDMAEGLNRVILLGNLGADPELRVTNTGSAVLKMRLATSETYLDRNKQRQERTEWHNVVVWGRRAEALSKFLGKGDRLLIEGSLRTTSYDDRDGNKKYRTEIIANNVVLSGGRGGGGGAPRGSDDDAGPSGGGGYDDADYGGGDDDIPF